MNNINMRDIFNKVASTLIGAIILATPPLIIKVYNMDYKMGAAQENIAELKENRKNLDKYYVTKIEFNKTIENIDTNIKKIDKNIEKLIEKVYDK